MKGIIKLSSIENPEEGMKVIWNNKIYLCNGNMGKEEMGYLESYRLIGDKFTNISYEPISVLQQLVVEYESDNQSFINGDKKGIFVKLSLPIPPDDWERNLPKIGQEVAFIIWDGGRQSGNDPIQNL